jgi:hypothetical protein
MSLRGAWWRGTLHGGEAIPSSTTMTTSVLFDIIPTLVTRDFVFIIFIDPLASLKALP